MEDKKPTLDTSSDVLHIPSQTKLTPEQVAKAVAHHNRHHPTDQQRQPAKAATKEAPGKKMR